MKIYFDFANCFTTALNFTHLLLFSLLLECRLHSSDFSKAFVESLFIIPLFNLQVIVRQGKPLLKAAFHFIADWRILVEVIITEAATHACFQLSVFLFLGRLCPLAIWLTHLFYPTFSSNYLLKYYQIIESSILRSNYYFKHNIKYKIINK